MLYKDLKFCPAAAGREEMEVQFPNGWGCYVLRCQDRHNLVVLCQGKPHNHNPVALGDVRLNLSRHSVQECLDQIEEFQLSTELAV